MLLKNDQQLLPLSKVSGKILVAGTKANDIGSQCGGWTISWQGSTGNITPGTSIYWAIKTVRGGENVVYSTDGTTSQNVDVAVVVVGETPYAEGQGDSPNLALSAADLAVISNVEQLGIPYVVLLLSGRPLIVNSILEDADAFVACWLPGTEAFGITDVLFGDYDFTGMLSHTWPSSYIQEPINWGDSPYQPLFPYGYGLSYANNGVPSTEEGRLLLYPNPATDVIYLRSEDPGSVEIYSLDGDRIYREEGGNNYRPIDISHLASGVYVVNITTGGTVWRQKLVKMQ